MEDGWQPIETAPKDASSILLAMFAVEVPDGPLECRQTVGCWEPTFEYVGEDEYRGAWTDYTVASWGHEEHAELNPTHWMPLPAPPKIAA